MKPLCIAHRGKHDKYFENTLNAFKEAAKGDFYGIETDIHLTKDNYWVIHHDPDFLSDGKKYVIADMTKDEVIKLHLDNDQGDKDAYIPLFEDYLKICKESGKRPIIEFKPKNPKRKHLKQLTKYIDEYMGLENVTFIAFYPWPLIKLRNMYHKRVHLQLLLEEGHYKTLYKWAKFFKMDIDIEDKLLTQDLVDLFHKKNLKVNVWTVDDEKGLRKLEEMGVDYITTNVFQQQDQKARLTMSAFLFQFFALILCEYLTYLAKYCIINLSKIEKGITMKKILLFGLTAMSTFALMGCDMITGLFEKSYNYNDFRALLADRKLVTEAKKGTAEIDQDGTKSTRNYTLKDGEWKYTTTIVGVEVEYSDVLDVVSDTQTCELAAALLNKKVDDLFKFYAKGDAYRITAEYKTDNEQIKLEYKYRNDGLVTYRYNKNTDLQSVKTTEKKITYTYSN